MDLRGRVYEFGNFTVHEIEGHIENLHIIEHAWGMILVDSGCISDVKRIERYFENIGRSLNDVKLIFLTHLHPDHAGGAVKLRHKYKIPIAAHKDIDNWYKGFGGFLQHKIDCYLASLVAFKSRKKLERMLFNYRIRPDYLLEDESLLPGFSDWQVLHVPGHTLYDLVLYNASEQTLFIADLICDVKGKSRLPIPVLFTDKMENSFNRLAKLPAKNIFRSHGELIVTNNNFETFTAMQNLVAMPLNPMAKKFQRIFYFAPVIREAKK